MSVFKWFMHHTGFVCVGFYNPTQTDLDPIISVFGDFLFQGWFWVDSY